MRRAVLLALAALALLFGLAPARAAVPAVVAQALREAESAYTQGDYAGALAGYRQVLDAGWSSASLYYDLGCAAQKADEPGWAVGYFEEARRRAPHDPDIRHNLSVALAATRERGAPPVGSSRLLDAVAALLDAIAPGDATAILVAAVWAGALVLAGSWLLGDRLRSWARRARPWAGAVLLAALALFLIKSYHVHSAPTGVVVAGEVSVRAGPRDSETIQFALHAGTFVRVGRRAGEWTEIALTPQMRGWVPRESILGLSAARGLP
jgi:hypothetical protein